MAHIRMYRKNYSRGHNLGSKKEGAIIIVHVMYCSPDLIHIPIKLHEDIPNNYGVIARTRMFEKNQRGIAWKLRKEEQSFLFTTCLSDLVHIPINLLEDILSSN